MDIPLQPAVVAVGSPIPVPEADGLDAVGEAARPRQGSSPDRRDG